MSKILGVPDIVLFLVFLSPLAHSPLLPLALRFSIQNPRRSEPAAVLARQRGSARKEEKKRGGPALASIVGATFFFPSSEGAEAERSKGKISKAKSELRSACSSAPLRSGSPLSLPLPVTTRQGAGRLLSAGEERAVERRQGAGERST